MTIFQRNIMKMTLRALICFSFLKAYGTGTPLSDIDLGVTPLDPMTTGFTIAGVASGDELGRSVSTAGDIDNDGYDDIIVGAHGVGGGKGAAYVIYGGPKSSMPDVNFSPALDSQSTGFRILGNAGNDDFGVSVSTAGDIDNDGFDDIIIGASAKNSNTGAAYVIYGGPRSSRKNIDLGAEALDPQNTGFMITGNNMNDYFGGSVSTAGDIDNDGFDDIIIGAAGKDLSHGAAYVIYGGSRPSRTNIVLGATLNSATTGFMITGNLFNDNVGSSVSTAGDINNDGFDDIIVGAYGKSSYRGVACVIYGGSRSSTSSFVFGTTTGFNITGAATNDQLGISVSTAGDIDNDGFDDIIVGSNRNLAYVIYGGENSKMTNIVLSTQTLDPQNTGFMITGEASTDNCGKSVGAAGDINNDEYADIIIGASGKNTRQGAAYVIYGGPKSSRANINLSSQPLDPLATGFKITGTTANNYFGWSVSTAGDINKNGVSSIIIGAYATSSNKGAAYVISGNICLGTSISNDCIGCSSCCSRNCDLCTDSSFCTDCASSYLLYQGKCFSTCPDQTFTLTDTCEGCSANCNHCTSLSKCTECTSPYYLYQFECANSCPDRTFISTDKCEDCPSHCSSCTSQVSCQTCDKGYVISNSLCVLSSSSSPSPSSSQQTQEAATQAISSGAKGIGSAVAVGSAAVPITALVSKTVQNTRYMNLSVTNDLAEIYKTWSTNMIDWEVPNILSEDDDFKTVPPLFARYDLSSAFLSSFYPTLLNILIGLSVFIISLVVQKIFEQTKYQGWAFSLVQKLVAGSFNFALVQAYACLDEILFYLVLDAKTNPFDGFFSCASLICAVLFLVFGSLLVLFNFWTVYKYQEAKKQGVKQLEAFNERNKYWELFYSDFNDDDLWSQSFFAILIIRSSVSSFIITVLYDYPLMQTSSLVILDGVIILFLYFKTPFLTLRGKLAQYYYEVITLLVHLSAFILSYQDSLEKSSDTVRLIFSTSIIYLNTALVTGGIGFMFIEIYKTISQKNRAARQRAQKKSEEVQNLGRTAVDSQIRINRNQSIPSENFYLFPREGQHDNITIYDLNMESSQTINNADSSILSEVNLGQKIIKRRNQNNRVPIILQNQPILRKDRPKKTKSVNKKRAIKAKKFENA